MRRLLHRSASRAVDSVMCAMMNRLQWKLRHDACTAEELTAYLDACEPLDCDAFYPLAPGGPTADTAAAARPQLIEWPSPHPSGFPENDTARALVFLSPAGWSAPTVILLHALMSASDLGYRRIAAWLNGLGWNAVFPHLPFHYSRVPRGHSNGALAITAHLPRNAETLRQAVMELRQLMQLFRSRGCPEFALIGTSYGGWAGSLLSFVEPQFRFLALIQPVIDLEHAIWENPGAESLRRILRAANIAPGSTLRHSRLSSPLHGSPRTAAGRILIVGGSYDTVSPLAGLRELSDRWPGSSLIEVAQGHFGYAAMTETLRLITRFL